MAEELKKGARVRLHALSTAVLNDAIGCIVGPVDEATGRHPVKLLSPPEAVAETARLSDTVRAKNGWQQSIPPAQQAEWFIDAYRLRVDDDYAWGGGNLHGLYDPESTTGSIVAEFMLYCKAGVVTGVVPAAPGWDWKACLHKAAGLLRYAYEKSDAQEKWGPMAGMTLRLLAEQVYGTSCMGMDGDSLSLAALRTDLGFTHSAPEEAEERLRDLMRARREVFNSVGGAEAWLQLIKGVQKEMNKT